MPYYKSVEQQGKRIKLQLHAIPIAMGNHQTLRQPYQCKVNIDIDQSDPEHTRLIALSGICATQQALSLAE